MTSLRETQELFWRLITAPEGVATGLRQIDMKSSDLERVLRGDGRLDAVERLDIYANMYFWRLSDILRSDYEALVAAIGDQRFHNLVTDYLLACPSQHQSVRNVGARLAQFLATHALGIERPWLAELARLERARLEVFDGADAEALTLDELRTRAPDAFAGLPLPLIPSHRLVEVEFAVDGVWRAVEAADGDRHADAHADADPHAHADAANVNADVDVDGDADAHAGRRREPPAAPLHSPRTLLVWRHDGGVYHRPLESSEQPALLRARDGAPFGVICDLLAETLPVEEAAPAAFQLLARWVGDGIIARP